MEGSNDFISPSRHTRTHTHTDTHTRKSNSIVLNRKLKKLKRGLCKSPLIWFTGDHWTFFFVLEIVVVRPQQSKRTTRQEQQKFHSFFF